MAGQDGVLELGQTVSSKPRTPGTSGSPAAMRLGGVAPHLLGHRDRLPARGPQVAQRSGAGRSGAARRRAPGSRRGRSAKSRPWPKPKPLTSDPTRPWSTAGPSRTANGVTDGAVSRDRRVPRAVTGPLSPPAVPGDQLLGQGAGGRASGGRRAGPAPRCGACVGAGERDAHQRPVTRAARSAGTTAAPSPSRDEGEDARHLAPLADQVRLDPRLDAGRQRHGPQVVALPEHDQVEAVEVADPRPAAGGRRGDRARWPARAGRRRARVVTTSGSVTGSTTRARSTSPAATLGHELVRARLHHRQVDAADGWRGTRPAPAPARW